jgi:hypothetical protein
MSKLLADALWISAIGNGSLVDTFTPRDWARAVRVGRRLRLLARLAASVDSTGAWGRVPDGPARELRAEFALSSWRSSKLAWAIDRVGATLGGAEERRVLLKGAAYMAQGLRVAAGRLPSDADILVPRERLDAVQATLAQAGWNENPLDEHDQRYYREWSHEVPPMRHELHPVELDLHHNILPPVGRHRVDAQQLLARVEPSGWPGWQVLHPQDQLLHSACHLAYDAEPRERLRDIVDADGLMREFGQRRADFWPGLVARARELGLTEPLWLVVSLARAWMQTPVPQAVQAELAAVAPPPWRRAWLLPLWERLLAPVDPDQRGDWRQDTAAFIVLARYHRNRMPLRLLLPHLLHKVRRPPADDPVKALE